MSKTLTLDGDHLRGLSALVSPQPDQPAFRVNARDMVLRPGMDLTSIDDLFDQLDGAGRR